MIKVLTAMNNPDFNNKLKKEKNIEIICKDIQYKDAIIELLNNKNSFVNIIIINQKIPGEINDEILIKKIKEINKKIKIIYILEKQNKNLEFELRKNNINYIYYKDEITIIKIIKIINKLNNNLNSNLKINEKSFEKSKIKNSIRKNKEKNKKIYIKKYIKKIIYIKNKILKNIKNNYFKNKKIKNQLKKNILLKNKNKIITFSGLDNIEKINYIINLTTIIKNKKILIVDFDMKNQNIFSKFNLKKYSNKINNLIKNNSKKELEKIINKSKDFINYFLIKINNNNNLISGLNLLSNFFNKFDNKKADQFFHNFFNQINNNYDLILINIGSKNNSQINNIIYKKSDLNIFILNNNFLEIKKSKKYLEKNIKNKLIKNKFKLILINKNKKCIYIKIINKIFNLEILEQINKIKKYEERRKKIYG